MFAQNNRDYSVVEFEINNERKNSRTKKYYVCWYVELCNTDELKGIRQIQAAKLFQEITTSTHTRV